MLHPARTAILPPGPAYPLYVTAKCYRPAAASSTEAGATLVLLHSAGFHKEMFEPTLAELFAQYAAHKTQVWSRPATPIREVWSIECPNQGESAVLNEAALRTPEYDEKFCAEEYAKAAYAILTSSAAHGGIGLDFSKANVVGVGHSVGGVSMIYLANMLPMKSLFIIEPSLISGTKSQWDALQQKWFRLAYERKDTWPNREAAAKYFKKATRWDDDVFNLFIQYGLRPHPASTFKIPYPGVTLSCSRNQEALMCRALDRAADDILDSLSQRIPTHLILGGVHDLLPAYIQKAIVSRPARHLTSVRVVEKAGHLIPQEQPQQLARLMYETLCCHGDTDARGRTML